MTICIASIAGKDTVIMTADKMVTVSMPNIKFERRTSKIVPLSNWCGLATAGDALILEEVLQKAGSLADMQSVEQIATKLAETYSEHREKLAEQSIVKPVGLTLQYIKEHQREMRAEIVMNVFQQMAQFRYDSVMLIAGIDDKGAHIYFIHPPGVLRCMDAIGYWAIGTGEQHALQTFITSEFDQPISFNRAMLVTYEAKKRAEKATGVGLLTDVLVIKSGKSRYLAEKEVESLERVYSEKVRGEIEWLKKIDKIDLGLDV